LRHPLGELVTGSLPASSAHVAARALVVLVPAAFLQLLAALAASALAALDSYGTAAAGFAVGAVVSVVVFVALADRVGIVGLAWGLAASAACAFVAPVWGLWRRGVLHVGRLGGIGGRLWRLVEGASVPVALQGCYLLGLRFAAHIGVGRVTSFSYAYLVASTLVGATAFSLGVISTAPLTRRGVDADSAARHVVHAAWVSLSLIGAAAGVFAVVGGRIMNALLGNAYGGSVGRELGRLVVYLSPWMLAWVGFAVAYPLVYVAGRQRYVVPVAVAGFVSCIPFGFALRAAFGLAGIAIAIGLATLVIAGGLLWALSPRTLAASVLGLARLALALGGATALAFGALTLALSPIPAAALGVLVYAAIVLALRSLGLSEAWTYVRGLQ
ncbi:MAG TPA: hypothetical protein VHD91_04490, partial [Gaiellaceae bacterium]|nr:hypothetical protein [Gaiellaceae bacterium]